MPGKVLPRSAPVCPAISSAISRPIPNGEYVSDEVGKALFSFRFVARRARKAASAARQCPVTEFTRAQAAGRSGELSWE